MLSARMRSCSCGCMTDRLFLRLIQHACHTAQELDERRGSHAKTRQSVCTKLRSGHTCVANEFAHVHPKGAPLDA